MKGIFLGACLERHEMYDMDYNDIDPKTNCNIICDMLTVNLDNYDFLIASPPCNYYSRANYRRDTSKYALETKHLLPDILEKFAKTNKPFLVENVRNNVQFKKAGIFDICKKYNITVQYVGRHTYFTNFNVDLQCTQKKECVQKHSHYSLSKNNYRQGGENVYIVIEKWLSKLHKILGESRS